MRDKEDLLILLVTEYADQIPHPELPGAPRDRIIVAATAFHAGLAAWPWVAEVVTTDGFIARVGESALALVDHIVAGAIDYGCTPEQASGERLRRKTSMSRGSVPLWTDCSPKLRQRPNLRGLWFFGDDRVLRRFL